ncbi:MAG: Mur ligase family protein [Patescibacteria group bacterium]|nr:Mur ligase family protein [Patescibacteria group bacterium]
MQRAHLIGARGAGMQALAAVLDGQGWRLTGSDLLGGILSLPSGGSVPLCRGHGPENLPDGTDLVITSDAVPRHNPELQRAAERAIPTRTYFEMVAELTAGLHCMAVAGTHGKSSTVAMCSSIFEQAGRDPLVFCGAPILGRVQGGRFGRGPDALVEACEFRANFLHLHPRHGVLLGIDHDHFDCYPNKQDMVDAFARFVRSIPADGLLVARADCPDSRAVADGAACRVETFSLADNADWSTARLTHRAGCHEFDVLHRGQLFCGLQLRVPGKHNALNALAATALAHANGIPPECVAAALGRFPGVYRRLECLGEVGSRDSTGSTHGNLTLVDDYAHHPTEVVAALTTLRQAYPGRRLLCVYQPHQALRLSRLLTETAASLQWADAVVVANVFRAREGAPVAGEADAEQLAGEVRRRGTPASAPGDAAAIVRQLSSQLGPGDVLVTMGAGDIRVVAEMLLAWHPICPVGVRQPKAVSG